MRKMQKILLLTTAGIAVLGANCVYAKIIPGYDRPYDPPNYYSETSISWADTNNPSFFFIDLARQGMQVHDVPRDVKNNVALQNTVEQLNILIAYVNNKILDMTGLSAEKSNGALRNMNEIANNTAEIHRAADLPFENEQERFRTVATSSDPRKSFSREDQYIWIDKVYAGILQATKDSLADVEERGDALNRAVQNANEAQGNLAANQSNTEVAALYGTEINRRNALLSNYVALEAAHDTATKDKALKAAENMKQGMTFRVADPYNPAETDQKSYTRPTGLGFVNFK